jgi:hypothetical protein
MSAAPDPLEKKSIMFENERPAEILLIRRAIRAEEALQALDIPAAQAAIIVAGSATPFAPRLKNRLLDLLSRGVAQAAAECEALLLDPGTKDGVSAILGQGVADRGRKTALVGVLSPAKTGSPGEPVTKDAQNLDPNHTHFLLNEQERQGWQAEMLCQLAEAATSHKDWVMTVLVGGETEGDALDLALETVRRGWNLVVLEGSGPLADEITRLKKQTLMAEKRTGSFWKRINPFSASRTLAELRETNPRLYEILSDGKLMIVGADFDAIQLRNLIKGTFTHPPKENILWTAWQRFAEYDLNSSRHRDQWRNLKNTFLVLGVVSTLTAMLYSIPGAGANVPSAGEVQNQLWINGYNNFMNALAGIRAYPLLDLIFRFTIILLPIVSSIILGIETRLKLGSKYILLRGAAESVKRGIYSYRVMGGRSGISADTLLPYNEQGLATHLGKIGKILLDSDVNEAAFAPYGGPIPPNMYGAEEYDDGFSFLDPNVYVKIRVGDQLEFYRRRTNQYEKRIRRLQYLMLIFGGTGTLLAAVGAQYWLPLTASIVSAFTAYLEYQQLEQILTKYNLTKSSLESAQASWLALPDKEREDPKNIQKLVRDVEAILESENQGWVQYVTQVQEAGQGEGAGSSG